MKSPTLIVCILFVSFVIVQCLDLYELEFQHFVHQYDKQYESKEEYSRRFQIFKDNLQKSQVLQESSNSAEFGVTKFMDLTKEEFRRQYLKFVPSEDALPKNMEINQPLNMDNKITPNPVNWDWRSVGAITEVQNQGQCGDPWAFCVTECIESYWFLAGNPLYELSNQQVVDCDNSNYQFGCRGGSPNYAYQYIAGCGLETNQSYPYASQNGSSYPCKYNPKKVVAGVKGFQIINGETGIYNQASAPNTGGPVSVCVDADDWVYYTGGVLTQCTSDINHCAQVTGYQNYGSSGAYWIVRNQWGSDWGVGGYIYIAIGQDLCSIGDWANIPIVSSGAPTTCVTTY